MPKRLSMNIQTGLRYILAGWLDVMTGHTYTLTAILLTRNYYRYLGCLGGTGEGLI